MLGAILSVILSEGSGSLGAGFRTAEASLNSFVTAGILAFAGYKA